VQLVGPSKVLSDQSGTGQPFANAREPLAQEFKRTGALDSDGFLVVVNHLKSKGDSKPPATGDNANGIQGAFNGDRVRQAHALVDFAKATAQADGTDKIFLVGDFNSYTQEDPMQVLYQNGFINQPSDDPRDTSYEFDGMAGHSTTCWRTPPRPTSSPAATSGRSTPRSPSASSTAATTTTPSCCTSPTSSGPPTTTRSSWA
jgi:predicted extracellular nuclease